MSRYKGLSNQALSHLDTYERILLHSKLEGGHLIWLGSMERGNYPVFHYDDPEGKTHRVPVRRLLYIREYGVAEPWVYNECGEDRCILPSHQHDARRAKRHAVKQRRAKEIRHLRVKLIHDLTAKGFKPEEISAGLSLNLATVVRIINH